MEELSAGSHATYSRTRSWSVALSGDLEEVTDGLDEEGEGEGQGQEHEHPVGFHLELDDDDLPAFDPIDIHKSAFDLSFL